MSYHLISREKFIPNGFKFTQPETGFQTPRMASFVTVVNAVISHRKANPFLVQKHGWNTDYDSVAEEIDRYNANLCAQMGWVNYIMAAPGDAAPPKSKAPSPTDEKQVAAAAGLVTKIWSGVKTLNDWIDSNAPAVPQKQSNQRASVCAVCPINGKGDFTTWFTKPAAAAIAKQVEKLQERKLRTDFDDKINICEACLCPMKLKVHVPVSFIKTHMSDAVISELKKAPECWIITEMAESK